MRTIYFFISFLFLSLIESKAQGFLRTEYYTPSSLQNYDNGIKYGSGDLLKVSGMYNLPLITKLNHREQITSLSTSIHGAYGIMNNSGEAINLNPDKILNLGLNMSYIRPISPKWSLLLTLGGGVYAAPDQITAKSILANGGAVFICKVKSNLNLGVGVMLTNSYGLPLLLPIGMVNWDLSGKYEFKIDVFSGLEVSGAVKFGDRFRLKLVGIEMDGMASIMEINGESMIYATTILRSYVCPEYKIGKSSTLYLGAGGAWVRGTSINKRSIKDLFKNFGSDKDQLDFAVAGYLTMGFRYGF